eukprot:TRINITY_DN7860_c0_g1_i1.p2 TRINITY_DN7860_c0_g1~~TRINITY_DN7860_c0_g1_i1.p2  ORF type:complete len:55 (-),score=16.01 TRINITY_DN7860_c0_g1_i1:128-292(-)
MLPFRRFQEIDGIHPDNVGAFHLAEVVLRGLVDSGEVASPTAPTLDALETILGQ